MRLLNFILVSSAIAATKQVLLYVGKGAAEEFLYFTENTLSLSLAKSYSVERVNADFLANLEWIKSTSLIVLPAGYDSIYNQELKGAASQNIIDFVSNGGKYLGIGGGAYYASANVNFSDKLFEHPLKFFPGTSPRPVNPKTDFIGKYNGQLLNITMKNSKGTRTQSLYVDSAGYFKHANGYYNIKVLGNYADLPRNECSIVLCKVKQGQALLSFAHPEYLPKNAKRISLFRTSGQLAYYNTIMGHWLTILGLEAKTSALPNHEGITSTRSIPYLGVYTENKN